MESVIPRLAVSLQKKKQDAMIGISEILLSFVAAFEHIPSQRRLGLFKSLADKLGASEYLFALLIILLDKHSGDRKTLEFAAELAGFYDVKTQFQVY
jgi:U3 small nucleolar RNA-associated protein 10